MKRIMISLLITMMAVICWCPDAEAYGSPTVYLDGRQLYFDVPPQIIKGRVVVPMRTIFEELGAAVSWNASSKTIDASKGSITLQMTIGSSYYYENGISKTLDVPAQLINGRTMVPLRLVSECMKCKVEYNKDNNVVTIESNSSSTTSGTTNNYSDEELQQVQVGDKWGFEDQNGNMVIRPQFDEVNCFSEGRAPVKIGEKYGYIDKSGKMVVNAQYDSAGNFSEGRAIVCTNEKNGYIDVNGNVVIGLKYEYAYDFIEGRAIIGLPNGKKGFIDKAGNTVIEAKYDAIYPLKNGQCQVKLDDSWYSMDRNGKVSPNKLVDNFEIENFEIINKEIYEPNSEGETQYKITYKITLKNTGNTTWSESSYWYMGYYLGFRNMDDSGSGTGIGKEVKPGESYTFEDSFIDVPGYMEIRMEKDSTTPEEFGTPFKFEF
ncbi:MAG: WG repeat-containing protein [Methanobacterium sp.]